MRWKGSHAADDGEAVACQRESGWLASGRSVHKELWANLIRPQFIVTKQRSAMKMNLSLLRMLLLLGASLMSSCTTVPKEALTPASCCSPLPLGQIAKDLGLHMEELGMHGYRFYNERCEFELLASSDEIHLVDESTKKSDKFSPVWSSKGAISEHDLKSKIRTYLHGK